MIAFVRMLIEEAAVLVALALVVAMIFVWGTFISNRIETANLRHGGDDTFASVLRRMR